MNDEYLFVKCGYCGALNKLPEKRITDKPICGKCKKNLEISKGTFNHPVEVTDGTFPDVVLAFPGAVMTEFYASWCGACKMLAPTIDTLAREYSGKIKFAKINVERNTLASAKYQIKSTPTMILFKNGAVVNRLVGALPKHEIERNLRILMQ